MPATQSPIPVHVLDDTRIHLAPPHHGRLRQGRLKTLCGKLAVSELPLFVMAEKKGRCPTCFSLMEGGPTVDEPIETKKAGMAKKPARTPAAQAKLQSAKAKKKP